MVSPIEEYCYIRGSARRCEKQIVGFDRETLTKELEAAGYMDKAKEAEKAEKAKQQAENESEGVADDEVEAESEAIEDTASAEEAY